MGSMRLIAVSMLAAAGMFQISGASAQSDDAQVVRGGKAATIIETQEASVRVFRGSPTMTVAVAETTVGAAPIGDVVSSGSTVWFVDREANKLQACRLVSTTQVGEHRIDCHSRSLPR